MCTYIAETAPITGAGKAGGRWFPVTQVTVGYDHTTFVRDEHALLIDFVNYDLGTGARLALELDLASGRALLERLRSAIEAAEATGLDTPA